MSGQYVETPTRSFVVGATAVAPYTRVKLTAGLLVVAGLADVDIGTMVSRAEADAHGAVRLPQANGTNPMMANQAIDSGAYVFTAADGKISDVAAAGAHFVGKALEGASGDGAVIEVLRHAGIGLQTLSGVYTATADDATAGSADIVTGLASIVGLQVMILRSDVVQSDDQVVTIAGGTITVADGASTYSVTAGDTIYWTASGGI